jgi:hypothetical protein
MIEQMFYLGNPSNPFAILAAGHLRRSVGDVAQLGEHRVRIAGVRGSSPLISTTPPSDIGRFAP